MVDKNTLIEQFNLSPHPEGGYYGETYRSESAIETEDGRKRPAGTAIYYLLTEGVCSRWHRVRSDELWHFYHGSPLVLEFIDEEGNFSGCRLSDKMLSGAEFQQLVPAGCWQRAYSTGEYSLVGCTVHPGFEFEDFEMGEIEELAEQFPGLEDRIRRDPFG